jgi:predicted RNase H-like HicB family nuclease
LSTEKTFMRLNIELAREENGRWMAAVLELPGVAAHGDDRLQAFHRAEALALRALAARLEGGQAIPGAPAELALVFSVV